MADILFLAGLGVAVFAFIAEIISVSLEYWVYFELNGTERYGGLWKSCAEGAGIKLCSSDGGSVFFFKCDPSCEKGPSATDELRAVQAMVILALLCTVASIICGFLKMFVMKEQKLLLYVTTGLLAAAGLFLMIGFSVYVGEIYDPIKSAYDLHAGFAFCVIAWLAAWVAAAVFGLITMKAK